MIKSSFLIYGKFLREMSVRGCGDCVYFLFFLKVLVDRLVFCFVIVCIILFLKILSFDEIMVCFFIFIYNLVFLYSLKV